MSELKNSDYCGFFLIYSHYAKLIKASEHVVSDRYVQYGVLLYSANFLQESKEVFFSYINIKYSSTLFFFSDMAQRDPGSGH